MWLLLGTMQPAMATQEILGDTVSGNTFTENVGAIILQGSHDNDIVVTPALGVWYCGKRSISVLKYGE